MSMDADALLRSQQDLHGRIARAYEYLKKSGTAKITVGVIESRLQTLEAHWNKFEQNHEELCSTHWNLVSKRDYIKADYYGLVEEAFTVQRGTLMDCLSSLKSAMAPPETPDPPPPLRRTLPRIQLPTFSGKYEEWPAFRDLFRSLVVTDPAVPSVEQLFYLRSSVKGEAEKMIRNIPTTDANFDRAWSMLVNHYENKRLLVRSCLSSFLAIPKMKNASVGDLKCIFHGMLNTVGTLGSIDRPITDCTDLLVHLIVEMLDSRSRRDWKTAIGETSDPPSYETLKTFLECRMRTLEALHPTKGESSEASGSKSNASTKSARSHVTQKTIKKGGRCPLCQGDHYILFCSDFQRKKPTEKKTIVESNHLCPNCLGKHQLADCQSKKSCAACNARHHSSTHDAYASETKSSATVSSLHVQSHNTKEATVLLATARVNVLDRQGTMHQVRAIVDSGSEVSLVTEALAQRFRLQRPSAHVSILGIGGRRITLKPGVSAQSSAEHTGTPNIQAAKHGKRVAEGTGEISNNGL